MTLFGSPSALTETGSGCDGSMELRKAAGDWLELADLDVRERLDGEGTEVGRGGGGGGGGSGKGSTTEKVAVGLKTGGGGGGGEGDEGAHEYSPSGAKG